MTPQEFDAAARELGVSDEALAAELGVTVRTIARHRADKVRPLTAVAIGSLVRLKRLGLPWRKNEVAIDLTAAGIVQLDDAQAAARHARLKDQIL